MRVDLPAPFSPQTAWISPASTRRSTRSLATTPGNRLVMPSSSTAAVMRLRWLGGSAVGADASPAPQLRPHPSSLGDGGNLDLAGDDLLLEVVELAGDVVDEAPAGRIIDALGLEVEDQDLAANLLTGRELLGGPEHGRVHLLQHRREDELAELLAGGEELIA